MVSPTARRLPCPLRFLFPLHFQSNYDELTLGSLGTTFTSKQTRDTAAFEICGSSFCNCKRKVLIFQMLAVEIKIISICGFDGCLGIVFLAFDTHMGFL